MPRSPTTPTTKALDPLSVKLGSRIRQHREKQGWSQEGFALAAGVDRGYMGVIERGELKRPGYKILVRIAKVLGITLEQLLPIKQITLNDLIDHDPPDPT